MPCCGCCCAKVGGECCGPEDDRNCCKPDEGICCGPDGETQVCCPPERDCCSVYTIGEGEAEVCCTESQYCCFGEANPTAGICCEDTEVCCPGDVAASCCSPNQYCCDGVCSDTPCCAGSCDDENPCDEGCYCCDVCARVSRAKRSVKQTKTALEKARVAIMVPVEQARQLMSIISQKVRLSVLKVMTMPAMPRLVGPAPGSFVAHLQVEL